MVTSNIGATLREARVRRRLDLVDAEAETKIRVRYLRALENEEWDLLPGPTYVKTFLRTYADALGLDGRMLVEEYKLRHERLSDVDLQPISPRGARERARERSRRSRFPRFGLVAIVIVGRGARGRRCGNAGGLEARGLRLEVPKKAQAPPPKSQAGSERSSEESERVRTC